MAVQVFKGDIGMRAAKKEPHGLMQVLGLEVINHPEAVQLCREQLTIPGLGIDSNRLRFQTRQTDLIRLLCGLVFYHYLNSAVCKTIRCLLCLPLPWHSRANDKTKSLE